MTVYELIQELTYYDADMDIEFNVKLNEVDAEGSYTGETLVVDIQEESLDFDSINLHGFVKGKQWVEINFKN